MDDLLRLITLQDSNTRVVLLSTTVLGVAAGVVGVLAMLRRRSLLGDAMSHAALPGVCAAYLVLGERSFWGFMVGAVVAGLCAVGFVQAVRTFTRVKEDAAIAIAIGGFFGVGIVLSRVIQNQTGGGNKAGLDGFLFGQAASMVRQDAWAIGGVSAAALIATSVFYKELKAVCFDAGFAAGQGWPTKSIDFGLMALVCVCTVVGLPAVGVVLMVAMLVIPGAAARFWSDRLGVVMVIAGVIGGGAGLMGTVLSAVMGESGGGGGGRVARGWPTGPMIVLVAALVFVVSLVASPGRGVAAMWLRRARMRRKMGVQHVLRDAYESLEERGDFGREWDALALAGTARVDVGSLRRAERAGLLERRGERWALTPGGQREAAHLVRIHRLWETYLIEHADIAPDHVDRDADEIEHVLAPEVVRELEEKLRLAGRMPRSPHPIGEGGAA